MSRETVIATNKNLIEKFYNSFSKGDVDGMISCYADDIRFEDPAFGPLQGEAAKNMWRMLIARSKGALQVTFSNVKADENNGSADWVAMYMFSKTKRRVINRIQASFAFEDGNIIKHTDQFDIWHWATQALGLTGMLLGWSSIIKNKIRKNALAQLQAFSKK